MTAVFSDVQDLTPQAAVRVNDVAVGDVTGITVGQPDLKANVDMRINSSVHLPANAVATLEQTTLLGEKFVALAAPGNGIRARGTLSTAPCSPTARQRAAGRRGGVRPAVSRCSTAVTSADLQTITVELSKALPAARPRSGRCSTS